MTLALLIAVCLAFYLTRTREPSYESRTLTEWLDVYYRSSAHDPNTLALYEASTNAVKHIGTNAIPFLIKKLTSRETKLQSRVRSSVRHMPRGLLRQRFFQWTLTRIIPTTPGKNIYLGEEGFKMLGTDARSALQDLIRLSKHPDSLVRFYALISVRSVQPKQEVFLPILLQSLHDPDAGIRKLSAEMLADSYPEEAEYAGVYKLYPALKPAVTNGFFTDPPFGQAFPEPPRDNKPRQ